MTRFRPNLVVDGGEPYEEDRHRDVRVGAVRFRMPTRCARCQVTTVDPSTATVGKEPLRTLAKYRTEDNHVYFGQNLDPGPSDGTDRDHGRRPDRVRRVRRVIAPHATLSTTLRSTSVSRTPSASAR